MPAFADGAPTSVRTSAIWTLATCAKYRLAEKVEPGGSFEIFMPREAVCVSRARGHLSVELARLLPEIITPLMAERPFAHFHDWGQMQSYDSGARRLLTNWVTGNVPCFRSLDFIVATRIVAMGIAAANVATSLAGISLVAHTRRATFEGVLTRAL